MVHQKRKLKLTTTDIFLSSDIHLIKNLTGLLPSKETLRQHVYRTYQV